MGLEIETIDLSRTKDPLTLFQLWREEAKGEAANAIPDAMTLSTIKMSISGGPVPASRTVLLRGFSPQGFKLYTSYLSPKGRDIENNPAVSLVFVWVFKKGDGTLGNRQVRVEGFAQKLSRQESQAYFESEPILAQIRTVIQSQSARVTDGRASIIARGNALLREYEGNPSGFKLQCPEGWGGYVVVPLSIEFYEGTRDALNDRVRFFKGQLIPLPPGVYPGDNGWLYEQLEP